MGDKPKLAVQPSVSTKTATPMPEDKPGDVTFTLQTDVDDLIKLVEEKKEISMADASKILGVPQQTVESWAIFLEEDGVLKIKYKLTTPYIVSKSLLETEEQQSDTAEQPADKHHKNQILLTGEPIKKPKLAASTTDVPHILKQISKDMDNTFSQAYELIEAGRFEEVKRLYDSIRAENDSLPEELKELKREISTSLTKLNKDIGVNLERYTQREAKNIEKEVMAKLQLMQRAFETGDLRQAENHYYDIQKVFSQFPPGFGMRKTELQSKINLSYRKLLERKKEFLFRYNQEKTAQISAIIKDIRLDLQKKDMDAALSKYEEAKKIYSKIPEGFVEENLQLSTELFSLALDILTQKKSTSSQEFLTLATQLKDLMRSCYASIKNDRMDEAEQLFNQAKEVYRKLPTDFFNKRIDLETDFLILEDTLMLKTRDTSLAKVRDLLAKIDHFVKIANDYLGRGDVDLAEGVYYEIIHLYKALPDGFLEQKVGMGVAILNLYREIIKRSDEPLIKEFDENINLKYNKILQLLVGIREDMEKSRFDVVESKTKEVEDLFGHLPFKFVQENTKLYKEIDSLSAEVALYEKSNRLETLSNNPQELKKAISEIKVQYSRLYTDYQSNPAYASLLTQIREKYNYYLNLLRHSGIRTLDPIAVQQDNTIIPQPPLPSHMRQTSAAPNWETLSSSAENAQEPLNLDHAQPTERLEPVGAQSLPDQLPEISAEPLPDITPQAAPELALEKQEDTKTESPERKLERPSYTTPFKSYLSSKNAAPSQLELQHNVIDTLLSKADEHLKTKELAEAKRVLRHIETTYGQTKETYSRLRKLDSPTAESKTQSSLVKEKPNPAAEPDIPSITIEPQEKETKEITPGTLKIDLIESLLSKANHALETGRIEIAEMLYTDLLKFDAFNSEAKEKLALIENIRKRDYPHTFLMKFPEAPNPDVAPAHKRELTQGGDDIRIMKLNRLLRTLKSEANIRRFTSLDEKYREIKRVFDSIPEETLHRNGALVSEVQILSKLVELNNRSRQLSNLQHDTEQLNALVEEIRSGLSEIPQDTPYAKITKNLGYACSYYLSSQKKTARTYPISSKAKSEEPPQMQLILLTSSLRSLESKINQRLQPAPKKASHSAKRVSITKRPLKKLKTLKRSK